MLQIPAGEEDDSDDYFQTEDEAVKHSKNGTYSDTRHQAQSIKAKEFKLAFKGAPSTRLPQSFCEMEHVEFFRAAVIQGNLDKVKELHLNGFDINTSLKPGWSGLMYAANYGHVELCTFLIHSGANVNFSADGFTPLMAACSSSQTMSTTASPPRSNAPLSIVRDMVEGHADVNAVDKFKSSALLYICKKTSTTRGGDEQIIEFLLESGADVNHQDIHGWSALFWAVHKTKKDTVACLLKNGASTKLFSARGETISHIAKAANAPQEILNLICSPTSKAPIKASQQDDEGSRSSSSLASQITRTTRQLQGEEADTDAPSVHAPPPVDVDPSPHEEVGTTSAGQSQVSPLASAPAPAPDSTPTLQTRRVGFADFIANTAAGADAGRTMAAFQPPPPAATISNEATTSISTNIGNKAPPGGSTPQVYGELELVLTGLSLGEYTPLFHEHKISFEQLLTITDSELVNIGVKQVGARKKILEGILHIHKRPWKAASADKCLSRHLAKTISCMDAVAMVANLSRHASLISCTIAFVRQQLEADEAILMDPSNVRDSQELKKYTREFEVNIATLFAEITRLKSHMVLVTDGVECSGSPELIDESTLNRLDRADRPGPLTYIVISSSLLISSWLFYRLVVWYRTIPLPPSPPQSSWYDTLSSASSSAASSLTSLSWWASWWPVSDPTTDTGAAK